MRRAWIVCAAVVAVVGIARAADVQLQAQVSGPAHVGETVELTVTATGAQNVPTPTVPAPDGLQIRYYGPETQVSIVNGAMTTSITHHFRLTALKPGDYQIGPIAVDFGGKTLSAGTVAFKALPPGAAAPNAPSGAPGGNQLKLLLETPRTQVYLHEPIPVTVKLMVGAVRASDLQYPSLPGDGFSAEKFPEPQQRQERTADGTFQVVEFQTTLTPLRTGTVTVGPAMVQLSLMNGRRRSFFDDGAEPVQLHSDPLALEVLPLPDAGKPPGFGGAVGRFDFTVSAAPLDLTAGDPVTVTMTVRGQGNLDQIPAPAIAPSDLLKTYPVQAGAPDKGSRSFEQVVIPQKAGRVEIPALTFSWFDTEAKAYRSISRGPFALTVRPAAAGAAAPQIVGEKPAASTPEPEQLGRDIVSIKDDPGVLRPIGTHRWRSPWFWCWQPVPVLLWMAAGWYARRRERESGDHRFARFTRAGAAAKTALAAARVTLAGGDRAGFYDQVATAVRDYLAAKLDLPPGGVTGAAVEERLAARKADTAVAAQVEQFFAACEQVRFAPTGSADAEATLGLADTIVKALERLRGVAPLLVLALLAAGVAIAANDGALTTFFRANALYGEAKYADAAAEYEKIVATGVDSPALYFNLGNAYFKTGDVGRTILNYERARVSTPGDPDLRANLAFAREQSGDADPTPLWVQVLLPLADRVATDTLLLIASMLVSLTFLLLAAGRMWPAAERFATVNAIAAGIVAVLVAVSAVYRLATVDVPAVAVVVGKTPAAVRFEPQASGTTHFEAKPGAVLHVIGDREGWVQVERTDGRRGWIPNDAVALR